MGGKKKEEGGSLSSRKLSGFFWFPLGPKPPKTPGKIPGPAGIHRPVPVFFPSPQPPGLGAKPRFPPTPRGWRSPGLGGPPPVIWPWGERFFLKPPVFFVCV